MKFGIIGAGNIAIRMTKALHMVEEAEAYAIASRDYHKAEAFAKKHNIKKVYKTYEELYNDPEVDIIYIATTHNAHAKQAVDAMNHGKHLLIEKPMVVNEKECLAVMKAAKDNNVFCMEALWTRFLPVIKMAKNWAEQGMIGDITAIRGDYNINMPDLDDKTSRMMNPDTAGGAVLDLGVYPLNFTAMFLSSQPVDIKSFAITHGGIDINDSFILRYENAIATLRASISSKRPCDGAVSGTKGHIYFDDITYARNAKLVVNGEEKDSVSDPLENGFEHQVRHVIECIRANKKESDVMPLSETLNITRIMDKLRSEWGVKYPFE